jgi:hypothetical protein
MNRAFCPLIALLLGAAAPADARGHGMTGRWLADLDSQSGLPTDIYLVAEGIYSCESCTPPRRYPADGNMHPAGDDRTEAVRIVDARTIVTRIVQPDLTRETTMRVSADGRTATYVSLDRRRGIDGLLRTEYVARRSAAGPPGSHAVSGTWQGVRYVTVPAQLRTSCFEESGDGLTYRSGTGYSYTARFGEDPVPIAGPYNGSLNVSIERVSPLRIVETRRQEGRLVQVRTYTLSRNGRTLESASYDPSTGTTFRVTARRQRTRDLTCRTFAR